eukprot:CAMPEP_0194057956 /NCGR_PEP_ID=MMETSP0009_2-20130614/64794_1 /TAXON_ID=210454 /ORGANISM="Grammatophora oceanica, Strain CCMP 410" /LENGTH=121 /DNA_ID=CAMNT_0038707905 /DNA_START=637 /DNA_END=1002 /DNA_ORIENTATION=+
MTATTANRRSWNSYGLIARPPQDFGFTTSTPDSDTRLQPNAKNMLLLPYESAKTDHWLSDGDGTNNTNTIRIAAANDDECTLVSTESLVGERTLGSCPSSQYNHYLPDCMLLGPTMAGCSR